MEAELARLLVVYGVLPLWLAAGLADYLCHRLTRIEATSGTRESLLHLVQLAEVGLPILVALFLEINALVLLLMLLALALHQTTAVWDVRFAGSRREVMPVEQHIHGMLEMLPLAAVLLVVVLHAPQVLAVFGFGPEAAHYRLRLKQQPVSSVYAISIIAAVIVLAVIHYLEELARCLRAQHRAIRASGTP